MRKAPPYSNVLGVCLLVFFKVGGCVKRPRGHIFGGFLDSNFATKLGGTPLLVQHEYTSRDGAPMVTSVTNRMCPKLGCGVTYSPTVSPGTSGMSYREQPSLLLTRGAAW